MFRAAVCRGNFRGTSKKLTYLSEIVQSLLIFFTSALKLSVLQHTHLVKSSSVGNPDGVNMTGQPSTHTPHQGTEVAPDNKI